MAVSCMKYCEGLRAGLIWNHHSVCVYTESKAE